MQWIKVENELPIDGKEVLLLIEGYFQTCLDPLAMRKKRKIFEGHFTRRHGWQIPYSIEKQFPVVAWMPKPSELEDE